MKQVTEKRRIGDIGEEIACRFLMKRGFSIVCRNYLRKWGELDIVGKRDKKIHFFEVKTVSGNIDTQVSHVTNGYRAEDNMHPWKLKRLSRIIQTYLLDEMREKEDPDWQFDVITVIWDEHRRAGRVEILEDVTL
ncbi:MAG TPA: YraN family protein [Candidatus Paceibacterota bacterium]